MRIDFGLYEGYMEELLPGYQEVSCHIIFDVNMGDNFLRKSRMVSRGLKQLVFEGAVPVTRPAWKP